MSRKKQLGTFYCIASAIIFGLTPAASELTFAGGSNPLTLTFYRNSMIVPVLLIMLLIRKVDFSLTKRELRDLMMIGILFRCTTTFILYSSYKYIGIGLATTLHFLHPVFTVVLGFFIFKNKTGKPEIAALVIAMIGICLIAFGTDKAGAKGIFLAALSALTYSSYFLGVEHTTIKKMDNMKAMFYVAVFNSIVIALVDIPQGNIVYRLTPSVMYLTFAIAIANSIVAYMFLLMGIKSIGSVDAAIYSMLEPVTGILSGIFFMNEVVEPTKVISSVLIIAGVMIPVIYNVVRENGDVSTGG